MSYTLVYKVKRLIARSKNFTSIKNKIIKKMYSSLSVNNINKEKIIREIIVLCVVCCVIVILFLYISGNNHSSVMSGNNTMLVESKELELGAASDNDYFVTRPNGRDDGGVVRVMFTIFSNRIDYTLCYAVASAYFTNIPIVVIGHNVKQYSHIARHFYWSHAAHQAGLHGSDIMVTSDSDIMFTGLDYLPFIDKFIKLSPANLNELDAKAVRTGQALPPVLYGTESGCWYPQTLTSDLEYCFKLWNEQEEKYMTYDLAKISKEVDHVQYDYSKSYEYINYHFHDRNNLTHINGGSSIRRVWAMKDMSIAIKKYTSKNKAIDGRSWWEDQSVLAKLYLELRLWEVEHDYFRKSNKQLRRLTNEYGLHAGELGLDTIGNFSVMMHPTLSEDFELTTERWHHTGKVDRTSTMDVFNAKIPQYISKLYNASEHNLENLFMERKLTRSYSNVHSVTIAPPLLSVVPRHINGKDKPAERVYPWLAHFAGIEKEIRYSRVLHYMQWFLPMIFDKDKYERGKEYIMSMPVELWSPSVKYHVRYRNVCTYSPFKPRPFY